MDKNFWKWLNGSLGFRAEMAVRCLPLMALLLLLVCTASQAHCQTSDNTFYAKNFLVSNPKATVADKVTAAETACNPQMQCFLVLDASLANYTQGIIPSLSAKITLFDYRGGVSIGTLTVGNLNGVYHAKSGDSIEDLIDNVVLPNGGGKIVLGPGYYIQKRPWLLGTLDGTSPITLEADGDVLVRQMVTDGGPGVCLYGGSGIRASYAPDRDTYSEFAAQHGGSFLFIADENSKMSSQLTYCDQLGDAATGAWFVDGVQFMGDSTMAHPPASVIDANGGYSGTSLSHLSLSYFDKIGLWIRPPGEAVWQASRAYRLGMTVHRTTDSGSTARFYECTKAGSSGATEPTWPTGGTVTDGAGGLPTGTTAAIWTDVTSTIVRIASVWNIYEPTITGRIGSTTPRPLVMESKFSGAAAGAIASMNFFGGHYQKPGTGKAIVEITGNGGALGSGVNSINFFAAHLEADDYSTTTTATASGFLVTNAQVRIYGADSSSAPSSDGDLVKIVTTTGISAVDLWGVHNELWPTLLNDTATGKTVAGTGPYYFKNLPEYHMEGTSWSMTDSTGARTSSVAAPQSYTAESTWTLAGGGTLNPALMLALSADPTSGASISSPSSQYCSKWNDGAVVHTLCWAQYATAYSASGSEVMFYVSVDGGSWTKAAEIFGSGAINAVAGYKFNGTAGLTVAKTIKGSDGNNCTLTISGGIVTATTCP